MRWKYSLRHFPLFSLSAFSFFFRAAQSDRLSCHSDSGAAAALLLAVVGSPASSRRDAFGACTRAALASGKVAPPSQKKKRHGVKERERKKREWCESSRHCRPWFEPPTDKNKTN